MREFVRHTKGFKIFLPEERISEADEYRDSDPYTVAESIDSGFHRRRIELTTELLGAAVLSVKGRPRVLDLGCGEGHITARLQRYLSDAEYFGLDYSISAIEYAHENYSDIEFLVGDAYDPPFDDKYFDVIVCNNLWEHVENPLVLLRRLKRVLKPGGHVIISTPSRYRLDNLIRVLRGLPIVFMSKHHVTEYSVGQVIEQLGWCGFKVKSITSKRIPARSLKATVAMRLFTILINLVNSKHRLEATVFYLAENQVVDGSIKEDAAR